MTEKLRINLRDGLAQYIKFIESKPELVDRFGNLVMG